jgi:hypothetical protein
VCAAALIHGIIDGDGDASDSADEVARLADTGEMMLYELAESHFQQLSHNNVFRRS